MRYRGLDAAAKELLARNVEMGTRADNAEAKCEDLEDKVKRLRAQLAALPAAWSVEESGWREGWWGGA